MSEYETIIKKLEVLKEQVVSDRLTSYCNTKGDCTGIDCFECFIQSAIDIVKEVASDECSIKEGE